MVTDPIYQLHMTIMHEKNLKPSTFTTSKDIKICQPWPEKRGVSKYTRTFAHPVVKKLSVNEFCSSTCRPPTSTAMGNSTVGKTIVLHMKTLAFLKMKRLKMMHLISKLQYSFVRHFYDSHYLYCSLHLQMNLTTKNNGSKLQGNIFAY